MYAGSIRLTRISNEQVLYLIQDKRKQIPGRFSMLLKARYSRRKYLKCFVQPKNKFNVNTPRIGI